MAQNIVYRQRRRGKDGSIELCSEIVRRYPTQDELKALYHYDPETGVFTNLQTKGKGVAGQEAGGINRLGYREMRVFNRLCTAHRLAVLYMTGTFPERPLTVDHINGIRHDNRWINLRLATMVEQNWNSAAHRDNQSSLKGAWPCKTTGRWQSIIQDGSKRVWLGRFDTALDAHEAWIKAATELRGEEWVIRAKGETA